VPQLTGLGSVREAWQRMFISAQQVNALAGGILNARRAFLAAGDTATALAVAQIYATLNNELNQVARDAARLSEVDIRKRIELTRSGRPDTARGGVKLKNTIRSEWAKSSPSLAYVGIGIIEELDKAVNPYSSSRETYWRAQEFGFAYTHFPQGFFMGPGYAGPASRPNPGAVRQHPLFVPSSKGGKFQKPPKIAARRFMRDGSVDAVRFWVAGVEAASLRAAAEMRKLGRLRTP
jgi:hypothetical protein